MWSICLKLFKARLPDLLLSPHSVLKPSQPPWANGICPTHYCSESSLNYSDCLRVKLMPVHLKDVILFEVACNGSQRLGGDLWRLLRPVQFIELSLLI